MIKFEYVIKDELGLHARPAGELIKECSKFNCEITITHGEKKVSAKKIFAVMGLAAKQSHNLEFSFDGDDENEASKHIEEFLKNNL